MILSTDILHCFDLNALALWYVFSVPVMAPFKIQENSNTKECLSSVWQVNAMLCTSTDVQQPFSDLNIVFIYVKHAYSFFGKSHSLSQLEWLHLIDGGYPKRTWWNCTFLRLPSNINGLWLTYRLLYQDITQTDIFPCIVSSHTRTNRLSYVPCPVNFALYCWWSIQLVSRSTLKRTNTAMTCIITNHWTMERSSQTYAVHNWEKHQGIPLKFYWTQKLTSQIFPNSFAERFLW